MELSTPRKIGLELKSLSWTCTASAGSSCTAAGAGNISESVDLLNGGTATFMATCTIDSGATGMLANTASISSAVNDPNMANNSATDTNTLDPMSDLDIDVTGLVTFFNQTEAKGQTLFV